MVPVEDEGNALRLDEHRVVPRQWGTRSCGLGRAGSASAFCDASEWRWPRQRACCSRSGLGRYAGRAREKPVATTAHAVSGVRAMAGAVTLVRGAESRGRGSCGARDGR